MLREGLVTYDFTFTPQPRLAESWEVNAEATEYTFHMRPNVTWHDGTPFTAQRRRLVPREDHVPGRGLGHDTTASRRASSKDRRSSTT